MLLVGQIVESSLGSSRTSLAVERVAVLSFLEELIQHMNILGTFISQATSDLMDAT